MPGRAGLLALLLLLAGCAAGGPDFTVRSVETAVVAWRDAAGAEEADARLETGAFPHARLTLTPQDRRRIVLERGPDGWRFPGGRRLTGAESLLEAWEAAAQAPDGESDVRTARFSVRYRKVNGELVGFDVVDVATSARLRLRVTR